MSLMSEWIQFTSGDSLNLESDDVNVSLKHNPRALSTNLLSPQTSVRRHRRLPSRSKILSLIKRSYFFMSETRTISVSLSCRLTPILYHQRSSPAWALFHSTLGVGKTSAMGTEPGKPGIGSSSSVSTVPPNLAGTLSSDNVKSLNAFTRSAVPDLN